MLFVSSTALSADSPYRLDVGTSVRDGSLKVEPRVAGPAGKALRYELDIRRDSQGSSSSSSQAGSVQLDNNGMAQLSSNAVTVNPRDKYQVTLKLFDADRLVAEQSVRHP